MIQTMVIQDLFCNSATIISRKANTVYEDGISKKVYEQIETPIKCRISNLNYKDLQLIKWVDDVAVKIQKLFTLPSVDIKATDYIAYRGEKYQVITKYEAQDANGAHHNKYFIKLVE